MAGDHPLDGDARRRHSSQQDGEQASNPMDNEQRRSGGGRIRPSVLRRNLSDPHGSHSDNFHSTHAPSSSPVAVHTGTSPRVRFSEDVQRRPGMDSNRNRSVVSEESHHVLSGPTRMESNANDRPNPPILHLQPGQASSRLGSTGQGTNRTAASLVSAQAPRRGSATMAPQQSPVAPHQRNRGYSLRRVLFAKGVEEQREDQSSPRGVDGALELQSSREYEAITVEPTKPNGKQFDSRIEASQSEDFKPTSESPVKSYERANTVLPNYEAWFQQRAARSRMLARGRNFYKKLRKSFLKLHEPQPSKDGRHIELDPARKDTLIDERTGRPYVSNTIRSSRYTLWTFFPRQLFAQFSKLANFYFLCVSILQMIPSLSTTGNYTTIVPLLVFVSVSMAKEGYDDWRRYRLDRVENNKNTCVLHAYQPSSTSDQGQAVASPTGLKHWAKTTWKDVRVGDLVKLERDEAAPADLVLLHANHPKGMAYIETMALDGETNLKGKQACTELSKRCGDANSLTDCTAHFVVEDPNLDLYNFEGKVTVAGETRPLTNDDVIYRGSILRNTERAFGIVIYTGEECKIRMNATKNPRIKAPSLQAKVNRVVIIIVIFVLCLAIFNTCAYRIWSNSTEDKSWYLTNAGVAFFPILASFIIMFNTLIPLSLYVGLEIVKLAQIYFMNDIDMYDEASNTPMEPRTSTINEELGQVSYIFSDKTGTLTDNSMRFRKFSIAGIAWMHDLDLQQEAAAEAGRRALRHKKRKGEKIGKGKVKPSPSIGHDRKSNDNRHEDSREARVSETQINESTTSRWKPSARPSKVQPDLRTKDLLRYLHQYPRTLFAKKARFFLLSMALCHTCLPEVREDGTTNFQAVSPDEVALVRAAQEMGYLVADRQANTIAIKISPLDDQDEPVYEVYEILDVIEFSSQRKRMSIIVRFPNRQICIFCKGADSTLMQLLRKSNLAAEKAEEIERRATKRKSLEAQEVIRRNSEHMSRKSLNRPSISVGRPSIGGVGRASLNLNRLQPIRDEIDHWLTNREQDVDMTSLDDSVYYTPRPSGQYKPRRSSIGSEPRSSLQAEFGEDLFDESLILDDGLVFERCFQHINDFATDGLRTLLYGFRYLTEQEYSTWRKLYSDATTSLADRQVLIEKAADMVERDFELAGATAIEDKLQKGVPEAIDKLRRARIKMWMLTGDKRETAVNVGHSCRLIKDYSSVTVLDHAVGHVDQQVAAALIECNSGHIAHSVVVIDGLTLASVEGNETSMSLFLDLAILVDTVICCRASPSQKASLVRNIRKKVAHSVTLAIGDGANDIAMIQEAHVGIGITGKEGLQAARTSDYSIAQFRFLLKLLLVHGRWNYIRVCKYTLATFWKEMVFYLTQALYQRWVGYTGTSLYEPWSLSMFNTLFTSLPVLFMGIFEKDLSASTLLAVPELYTKGQRSAGFNLKVYLGWMFMASSEAIIIFFVMLGLFGEARFTKDHSLYAMGVLTFSASVILISTKLQLIEMHNKSIMAAISFVLSVGGWFLWNILLGITYSAVAAIYYVKGAIFHGFGNNALWWLVLVLILLSCVVFELGVASLRSAWFPTDVDLFQEYEQDLHIRKRFEEAASTELQQGWNRGNKRASTELTREDEVQELLDRPRIMEEGRLSSSQFVHHPRPSTKTEPSSPTLGGGRDGDDDIEPTERRSVDIQEMLARRFGSIKRT